MSKERYQKKNFFAAKLRFAFGKKDLIVFAYISSHMGDIVVFLILALLVSAVIVRMIKDKKGGKGGCGCGCEGCANSPCCHPQSNDPQH